jgi:hypothetical protein
MDRDLTTIEGSQLDIQVERFDPTATSVDFIMKNEDTDAVIITNAVYANVGGTYIAQVHLSGLKTAVPGVYGYQINENTPTGINKVGNLECSGEDCDYGKVIICESLGGVVS